METISSYEEDQDKQSETGQESEEDNIDNETISVAELEKSEISAIGRKVYHNRSNKQVDRLFKREELELAKKLMQRSTQSQAPQGWWCIMCKTSCFKLKEALRDTKTSSKTWNI